MELNALAFSFRDINNTFRQLRAVLPSGRHSADRQYSVR